MAQHVDVVSVGSLSSNELFENWRYAISQGNIPRGRAIDPVTKWLLIVRACVFPMTRKSGSADYRLGQTDSRQIPG